MHGRLDELVDIMCDAVRSQSVAYASIRDERAFRANVARTGRLYVQSLNDGGDLREDALTALHVAGAQRCRQGIPEADMLDAVRWAAQAGAEFLIRASAEANDDAQAVAGFASVVSTSTLGFVADVQRALSIGWRTEQAYRLPAGARGQATLVDLLIDGGWTETELYDFARDEGVDLRPPCLPLIVTAGAWDGGSDLRAAATALASQWPGTVEGAVRTSPTSHVVVVLGNATKEHIPGILAMADSVARAHKVLVVACRPAERLEDVTETYRAPATHVEHAPFERRWPGLLNGERLRVGALLSRLDVEEEVDLCLSVLGPVLRMRPSKREELLTTFEALGEAGGRQKEAATLLGPGVNSHTVKYRLKRLETITDLHYDIEGERLLMGLAVRGYRARVAAALDDAPIGRQGPAASSSSVTRRHTAR